MTRRHVGLGFTLVELMVALMVSAVVLGAVVTLANATTCADDATDQMGRQQAQLRFVTMRLSELIRCANQVRSISDDGFQLWHDSDVDGVVDSDELTDITRGSDGDTIYIDETESHWQCENVSFEYDSTIASDVRFVAVWFDMDDNGITQTHTVSAKLRVSDDYQ